MVVHLRDGSTDSYQIFRDQSDLFEIIIWRNDFYNIQEHIISINPIIAEPVSDDDLNA